MDTFKGSDHQPTQEGEEDVLDQIMEDLWTQFTNSVKELNLATDEAAKTIEGMTAILDQAEINQNDRAIDQHQMHPLLKHDQTEGMIINTMLILTVTAVLMLLISRWR